MDQVLDNHFIQALEYKWDRVRFVRVDSDTVDKLVDKGEEKEVALSENEEKKVKELFTSVVSIDGNKLDIRALPSDVDPVQIVKAEFVRRMEEMQRLQSGGLHVLDRSMSHVVVNSNHPLI